MVFLSLERALSVNFVEILNTPKNCNKKPRILSNTRPNPILKNPTRWALL